MKESLIKVRQYLLTGVSFAIPFIACGGIMIAATIAFAPMTDQGPDFSHSPTLKLILDIGTASFTLMAAVLAGYISYAIAGKPGLVAGFVGGWLATHIPSANDPNAVVSAGFLGALVAGLLAGFLVNLLKKLPLPKYLKPIMPILIIPIVSSLIVGVLILKVIGIPIADVMTGLGSWLNTLGTGNAILLAAILGAMGIENELTRADIQAADAILFAVDIDVEKGERFAGRKTVQVPVQEAIKNPKGVLAKLG
jgi:fructose-specific phosphotransferase system IIC component